MEGDRSGRSRKKITTQAYHGKGQSFVGRQYVRCSVASVECELAHSTFYSL